MCKKLFNYLFNFQKNNMPESTSTTTSSSTTTLTTVRPTETIANSGLIFLNALRKYTITDINKLKKIAIDSELEDRNKPIDDDTIGDGRCSTSLASLCFATIEQIGLLLRTDLVTNVTNAITRGNRDNAKSFFSYFRTKPSFTPVSAEEVDVMYTVFRNKITHNLFPYHELGVAQNISNSLTQLVININGKMSLNINFIAKYTLDAVAYLERELGNPINLTIISLLDSNIALIKTAEETLLKNAYNRTTTLEQTLFNQWLPTFPF
jgi:hypothetical protein